MNRGSRAAGSISNEEATNLPPSSAPSALARKPFFPQKAMLPRSATAGPVSGTNLPSTEIIF